MKNKILYILPIALLMSLASCNQPASSPSDPVDPPIIHGGTFEEALKKDYKNMTVSYALNSPLFGEEYGYKYYFGNHDFVAVYDGNTAEMYGNEFAWMFYSFYKEESYAYWKQTNSYVTSGWVSTGSKGIKVGIDYAYFYMPYFLNAITKDDVESVVGTYVVKEESIDKVLDGLKFIFITNDITYIDIQLNSDGYISKIRGFDDPNDDEVGFQVQLGNFGTTISPLSESALPPEISEETIKTYEEMIGHEEEPDIYLDSIDIHINDDVESDDTYDIILDPDETIDLSFTYTPDNANKKEVTWISTDEEVASLSKFLPQQSGHKFLTGLSEGETEIYITHINEKKEVVSSKHLKVKVNHPQEIIVDEKDVYSFVINSGEETIEDHYNINASNKINNGAPFTISSYLADVRSSNNGDGKFAEDTNILCADMGTSAHMHDSEYNKEGTEILFDFDNQQVNSISFIYGLIFSSHKTNLDKTGKIFIKTSNDGETWESIEVTDEIKEEISKSTSSGMTPKILSQEFEPASMVKLVFTTGYMVGFTFWLGLSDFTFSANEECHNFNDPDPVPVESITVTGFRNKLKVGNSMKLKAEVLPANATNKNVKWASSDPEVVRIDSKSGIATALKEGTVTITATSVSNKNVVSNAFELTAYSQETIEDPDNLLIGKEFNASNIVSGTTTFDVSFKINNSTSATLTLVTKINIGGSEQEFKTEKSFSFDTFNADLERYEFMSSDNDFAYFKLLSNESIEFTYLDVDGNYILGSSSNGIVLTK